MKNTSFEITANGIEMSTKVNINYCYPEKQFENAKKNCFAVACDILGSFSKVLIASLTRRMESCEKLLLSHLNDIVFADRCGHIVYVRKNKTRGNFNVESYEAMQEAIDALKNSKYKEFMKQGLWIDQTIKALLNDTVQNHEDVAGFKYSQLVSLLCELHVIPYNDEV